MNDLDFGGFEQRALQAPAHALPPTTSGTNTQRPGGHRAPIASDGAAESDDSAEPFSWDELQAGLWRPGPTRMSAAERQACEAIQHKARSALRDAQVRSRLVAMSDVSQVASRWCMTRHTTPLRLDTLGRPLVSTAAGADCGAGGK